MSISVEESDCGSFPLLEVIIEDGVHILANCLILMGVTINKNSLIGANSLVNKSIPKNCVAYGQPVRVIESKETANEE